MGDILNDNSSRAADAAYKRLAQRLHPDAGGTTEAMTDLNALHDEVKEARQFQFNATQPMHPQTPVDVGVENPPPEWQPGEDSVGDADDDPYQPFILNGVEFPRGAAATIRAMPKVEYDRWLADREACLQDQLTLSRVLGYDLTANPHRAMFDFFMKRTPLGTPLSQLDPIKKRMCLLPRGIGKTFGIRVQEVFLILRFPTIRICFLTGGETLGKRQLAAVKNVFRQPTKRFKELFPEFCTISKKSKKGVWMDTDQCDWGNAHEFSVPARGESILAEPTFCISTARSVNSGSHFDVIYIDDLVNDSNFSNPTLLAKSYEDYLSICPLLDPQGSILMTGTRYAQGDTYEQIQETAFEMEKTGQVSAVWAFLIRDCWSTNCLNCQHPAIFHNHNGLLAPCTMDGCNCSGFISDGVKGVLFPAVPKKTPGDTFGHTIEFLNKTRAEQGAKFFACQYLNAPEQDGSQTFTRELIDSVTLQNVTDLPPRSTSTTYLVGDLAYSTSMERDESVIFAYQQFAGALYFWGCWWGRWSAADRVENILKTLLVVRPKEMFCEKNLNSDSLQLNLVAAAPAFGLQHISITWTACSNAANAKNARCGDIEAAMRGKRLFLYAKMPGYDRLVQQLLKFPNQKHDDFIDALSQGVAAKTGWQYEVLPAQQQHNALDFLHKLHQCRPADEEDSRPCGSYAATEENWK